MIVHFVGAGPGDPELLTRKAERLLKACRICIYAGPLVSPGVLALIPDQAERHDSAGMSLDEVIAVCRDARDTLHLPVGRQDRRGGRNPEHPLRAGLPRSRRPPRLLARYNK